tara:strand:- start:75 stop:515 length:441 start_codon:yes stop_codon:yes gene_type:complete
MALLGSSIDPSLFSNDYSGFAKAGAIQGESYAQLGKDVAGAIKSGADMYGQVKQFKGQQEAFGKSMDYMAKAFPDKAEMFTGAKSAVFDPNANMIQQAAAMSEYQNKFDMINKMQMQQAQLDMMNQRQQGSQTASPQAAPRNFYGQ